MKKIFYLMFFICLFFLSDVNFAEAKSCNYKSIYGGKTITVSYDGTCPIFYNVDRKSFSNSLSDDSNSLYDYYDLNSNQIDIKPADLDVIYVNTDYVVVTESNYKNYDYANLDFVYGYLGYKVTDKARQNILNNGGSGGYEYDSYVRVTLNSNKVQIGLFYKATGDYNYGPLSANTTFINYRYMFLNNSASYLYPSSTLYYRMGRVSSSEIDVGVACLDGETKSGCFQKSESLVLANLTNLVGVYKKTNVTVVEHCCYTINKDNGTYFILNRYSNNTFKQEGYTNAYFGTAGDNLFDKIEALSGQKSCPQTIKTKKYKYTLSECDIQSGEESENDNKVIQGENFSNLLSQLKAPLSNLSSSAMNIKLTIGSNKNATLNDVTESYDLCSNDHSACEKNASYLTEKGIKNIRSYCNEVYSLYPTSKDAEGMEERMAECTSFNNFYKELVNQGIINDLEDGCGIITDELAEKLNLVLDIIKIAGPLLALGLGTIDFVKVIVNGDADKEMKTAFKRFLTRLIAAALLFIIPIIIAFLLDIFMKPDSGYESDNPFCKVIDWDE